MSEAPLKSGSVVSSSASHLIGNGPTMTPPSPAAAYAATTTVESNSSFTRKEEHKETKMDLQVSYGEEQLEHHDPYLDLKPPASGALPPLDATGSNASLSPCLREVILTIWLPLMFGYLVEFYSATRTLLVNRVVPLLTTVWLTFAPKVVLPGVAGESCSSTSSGGGGCTTAPMHSTSHHHKPKFQHQPPPFLIKLALLTALTQISEFFIVMNEYGSVLSTLMALTTFASLFLLAYVIRKTLTPKTNPVKVSSTSSIPATVKRKNRRGKGHHHHHHSNKRGGLNHRSSGGASISQQLRPSSLSENDDLTSSNGTTILPSAPSSCGTTLPVLLEDLPVTPPLLSIPLSSSSSSLLPPEAKLEDHDPSLNSTTTATSAAANSRDRVLTEDTVLCSDDLSYESMSGRSTPTMAADSHHSSNVAASTSSNLLLSPGSQHQQHQRLQQQLLAKNADARNTGRPADGANGRPAESAVTASTTAPSAAQAPKDKEARKSTSRRKKHLNTPTLGPSAAELTIPIPTSPASRKDRIAPTIAAAAVSMVSLKMPPTIQHASPQSSPERWEVLKPPKQRNRSRAVNRPHQHQAASPVQVPARPSPADPGRQPAATSKQPSRASLSNASTPRRQPHVPQERSGKPKDDKKRRSNQINNRQSVDASTFHSSELSQSSTSSHGKNLHDSFSAFDLTEALTLCSGLPPSASGTPLMAFHTPARNSTGCDDAVGETTTPFGTPLSVSSDHQASFFTSNWVAPMRPHDSVAATASSSSAWGLGISGGGPDPMGALSLGAPATTCGIDLGAGSSTCSVANVRPPPGMPPPPPRPIGMPQHHQLGATQFTSSLSGLPTAPPGFTPTLFGSVRSNPFQDDDDDKIEAELQELGGQMVGSILDF